VLANMKYRSTEVQFIKLFDGEEYIPFIVVGEDQESPNATIYTLRPTIFAPPTVVCSAAIVYPSYSKRGVWSVECKNTLSDVSQFYIPLPPVLDAGSKFMSGDLRFLVTNDEKSQSPELPDGFREGGRIDIRGARMEYEIPDHVEEVLFLAGGGAITAALQVVDTLLEKRDGRKPSVKIIWVTGKRGGQEPTNSIFQKWFDGKDSTHASPNLRAEGLLDLEKYRGLVSIQQLIHRENASIALRQALRAEKRQMLGEKKDEDRKLLFIWGDEEFVEYFTSRKLNLGEWTLVRPK
jgi:cytochrome-b5 reductase